MGVELRKTEIIKNNPLYLGQVIDFRKTVTEANLVIKTATSVESLITLKSVCQ